MNNCYAFLSENISEEYSGLQYLNDEAEYSLFDNIVDTEASSLFQILDSDNCSLMDLPDLSLQNDDFIPETKPESPQFLASAKVKYTERQLKIQKYLEKKRKRTWHKKISYSCRKKVADQRLRVKGRFISKKQADSLSAPNPVNFN